MHACIIMMMGVHAPPTNHSKLEGSGLAEGLAGREKWLEDSGRLCGNIQGAQQKYLSIAIT